MAERRPAPGIPLWVKVFGAVIAGVVVILIVLQLTGGDHGPGRHTPSGNAVGQTPPSEAGPVEGAPEVVLVTMRDIAFEPAEVEAERGALVRLEFENTGALVHDFTIDHLPVEVVRAEGGLTSGDHAGHGPERAAHLALRPGASGAIEFSASETGEYEFYCDEPGHREGGMSGVLRIVESDGRVQ